MWMWLLTLTQADRVRLTALIVWIFTNEKCKEIFKWYET